MCRPQSFIWNNWHTGSEGRVNVQKPEIFQGRCHQILSQLQLASGPACVLSSPNQVQQEDFLLDTVHKNRVKDRHTHWYYTCIHWYIGHPIGQISNVTGTNQTVIINECLVTTFYKLATLLINIMVIIIIFRKYCHWFLLKCIENFVQIKCQVPSFVVKKLSPLQLGCKYDTEKCQSLSLFQIGEAHPYHNGCFLRIESLPLYTIM